MMFQIPGLILDPDLGLRVGEAAPLRLTPSAAFSLAESLLRTAAENSVREAARAARTSPTPRVRASRRAAA